MKRFMLPLLAASFFGISVFAQAPVLVSGLKGPSGIGMVKLFDEPPLAEGVPVRVEALAAPDLMVAKLVTGESSVGILPPNLAAKLAAAGRPVKVAAVVGTGMLSLLSSDPSIRGIGDLAGTTVEVAGQGATPDYVFRRILQKHGLDPEKDLRLGYALAYPEIAQGLIAGRVKTALLPEPFATMARSGNPSLHGVSDIQAEWVAAGGSANYPMTVVVVNARFAAEHPAALAAILDAYRASVQWVVGHPAEAGALVEKQGLGLKAAVAAAAIPKSSYVFIPAREAKSSIEALLGAFLEFSPQSIGGKLPDDLFYLDVPAGGR